MNFEFFKMDEKTQDAIIRNLEIVGKACKKIPNNVREKYPDIEWRKISGIRDILIHEYLGIDKEIIWDVVKNKLPLFKTQIQKNYRLRSSSN